MSARRPRLKHPVPTRRWRAGVLLASLLASHPAGAVFTFFPFDNPRRIQLQVGATGATINNVTFNVTGVNTSPSPSPVTGVPDALTPPTSPPGGVRVRLLGRWPSGTNTTGQVPVRLSVNSAAGLSCVAGTGCGSTVIPFTAISWTAHEKASFQTSDIQDGSFSGGADQPLADFLCCAVFGGSENFEMANTLVFSYNNTTLYPAGQYQGRVVFTASFL